MLIAPNAYRRRVVSGGTSTICVQPAWSHMRRTINSATASETTLYRSEQCLDLGQRALGRLEDRKVYFRRSRGRLDVDLGGKGSVRAGRT